MTVAPSIDAVVLLTPLVVLAVVLLLGFAGCHHVFGSDPPPSPFLILRVRVPMALVVREIYFLWDPPNSASGSKNLTKPPPTGIEGDDNLFDHELTGESDDGSWTVQCRIVVQGGTGMGAQGECTFTLPGASSPAVVTFQASGEAATLTVMCAGMT